MPGAQGESVSGLLSLVDLAGSERVSASMVSGDRLKEALGFLRGNWDQGLGSRVGAGPGGWLD